MKKVILLYGLTIALIITAVVGTSEKSAGENIVTKNVVLLNEDYIPFIDTITIENATILTLTATNNGYVGTYENLVFPVNFAKVNEMLLLISTQSKAEVEQIASKNSRQSTFVDGVGLKFSSFSDNSVFSSVIFGDLDFSGTMRYVKSTKNDDVYLIKDNLRSFLQTDPRAWLDPKLIADFLLQDEIMSISLSYEDFTTEYLQGDIVFNEVLDSLFSLQSATIVSPLTNDAPLHKIVITFRNGATELVEIHRNNETYVVVPQNNQLFYGLEISEWTYEKLITAFQK